MSSSAPNTGIGQRADTAATTDTGTFSLVALIKRLLSRFTTLLTDFGAIADVADTTGTLMARFRATLDRVGSYGDAATPTGSLMAQLRYIGESLNRATIISAINESVSGDRTIITGTAGKKIAISTLIFSVSTPVNITLKDGATSISAPTQWIDHSVNYSNPIILGTGNNFVINLSATTNLKGYVVWYLI